jgi:hypothetical protein
MPFIIVIQKGNELSCGISNARIARGRCPAPELVPDAANTWILKRPDNALDGFLGSIVDNNQFKIVESLAEYAANSRGQQPRAVASRNDDADEWDSHLIILG